MGDFLSNISSQIGDMDGEGKAQLAMTVAKILPAVIGIGQSNKAKKKQAEYLAEMKTIKESRQAPMNPYANVTNPYANMRVATKAAEMQSEQADIALANTLDTLEQTGASAGGATALAMAALKSKKDVAADIESQEAENAKLKAQGEQIMNREKVAAQTRYQDTLIAQGQRVQDAEIQGEIFQYQAHEARSNADIERYQGMYSGFAAQQSQAALSSAAGTASMIGGIGDIAGGLLSSDGRPK